MCIRDRNQTIADSNAELAQDLRREIRGMIASGKNDKDIICLLYTSDAADERSSVDLGGRRIINKKQIIYGRELTKSINEYKTNKR